MSAVADQIHALSAEEKFEALDILVNELAPKLADDCWPMDELDRRWILNEKGENDSLPLVEAINEARRVLSEYQA
jgi:hypothetical protein